MRLLLLAGLLLCVIAPGCGQPAGPAVVKSDPAATADPTVLVKEGIDVGDIEHGVRLEATLPEGTRSPQVQVEELRDSKKDLNMVTVTVGDPATVTLPIHVAILSGADTKTQPVVLRGRVVRDKTPMATFHTVLSPLIDRVLVIDGQAVLDWTFEVDVLKGLEPRPDSILVHVEADAYLMPAGTDPASIDAATATAVPTSTTTLLSNPVRINLAPAENPA